MLARIGVEGFIFSQTETIKTMLSDDQTAKERTEAGAAAMVQGGEFKRHQRIYKQLKTSTMWTSDNNTVREEEKEKKDED